LGSLVKDLNYARVIAELEKSVETDYQPIDNNRFYTRTYAEIKNVFKVSSFKRDISTSLRKEIFAKIDNLEKAVKSGADIRFSLVEFSESVSDISIKTIKSDKLKEKKSDTLLYIKLKITEESMEWQTIEDAEGNIISKLMVE